MRKKLPELAIYQANMAISTGLLVLYIFFFPKTYLLYTSAAVGLLTLLWPRLAGWISQGWYKLAEGLGYVNARILLSLLFFGLLLPLAVMYRFFNRNILSLHSGRTDESLYQKRDHRYLARDMENGW